MGINEINARLGMIATAMLSVLEEGDELMSKNVQALFEAQQILTSLELREKIKEE